MITALQTGALAVMAVFYAAYFAKKMAQKRQGVTTMILGKGDKPLNQKRLETALKAATFAMPAIEIVSMFVGNWSLPYVAAYAGIVIAAVGVGFFLAGMLTMKDSWRAGIPEKKETSLVTHGIYRISRNPAFVGFDLIYIGILIAFPNIVHLIAVIVVLYLFHCQILNEEKFLEGAFGKEYTEYCSKVRRYL